MNNPRPTLSELIHIEFRKTASGTEKIMSMLTEYLDAFGASSMAINTMGRVLKMKICVDLGLGALGLGAKVFFINQPVISFRGDTMGIGPLYIDPYGHTLAMPYTEPQHKEILQAIKERRFELVSL
jgi:hypothetical protein